MSVGGPDHSSFSLHLKGASDGATAPWCFFDCVAVVVIRTDEVPAHLEHFLTDWPGIECLWTMHSGSRKACFICVSMCLLDRSLTGSDPMVVVVASSVSLLSLLLIGLAVLVARGRNGMLPLPILDVGLASNKEGVGHDRRGQHVV